MGAQAEKSVTMEWTCDKMSVVYQYLKNNISKFDIEKILGHDNNIRDTKIVF